MSTGSVYEAAHRERLSALVDGELDAAGSNAACECWLGIVEARRDWHVWQLTGDVLRSEDLVSNARHDALFLAGVRERLAREPVVLAPSALAAASGRAARWWVPASVAAGFLLVVGTFTLTGSGSGTRAPAQTPGNSVAVAASDPLQRTAALGAEDAAAERLAGMPSSVGDARVVRDARLDRYLAAHKQFAGSSALGVPSVFLRGATVDTASR